jgi:hypothetical protein
MAVTVSLRGKTQVKRVVVGKPVRRVDTATANINTITGVDTSAKENGSVLVYNSASENFEATKTLEEQDINGGQY